MIVVVSSSCRPTSEACPPTIFLFSVAALHVGPMRVGPLTTVVVEIDGSTCSPGADQVRPVNIESSSFILNDFAIDLSLPLSILVLALFLNSIPVTLLILIPISITLGFNHNLLLNFGPDRGTRFCSLSRFQFGYRYRSQFKFVRNLCICFKTVSAVLSLLKPQEEKSKGTIFDFRILLYVNADSSIKKASDQFGQSFYAVAPERICGGAGARTRSGQLRNQRSSDTRNRFNCVTAAGRRRRRGHPVGDVEL
ncbi:hypothetical protein EVAR_60181_1 [Eumeta japonica]|uniref:Uncharacterized protein n=1 Tax=Eumeta variegata TaxID=151549 RepID=A0A4C1Z558_EUMVA|nr:hypothetical protein EVAR_60181_1 [Eumeta japonica]